MPPPAVAGFHLHIQSAQCPEHPELRGFLAVRVGCRRASVHPRQEHGWEGSASPAGWRRCKHDMPCSVGWPTCDRCDHPSPSCPPQADPPHRVPVFRQLRMNLNIAVGCGPQTGSTEWGGWEGWRFRRVSAVSSFLSYPSCSLPEPHPVGGHRKLPGGLETPSFGATEHDQLRYAG